MFESLYESAEKGELILLDDALCQYHLRRDGLLTIKLLIVLPLHRRNGVGRSIVNNLLTRARGVVARCPADLPSNAFWGAVGFRNVGTERARSGRVINVWVAGEYP